MESQRVPFQGVRTFLSEFRSFTETGDVPDVLSLYRDAQGSETAEVECSICGITLSASAMLACSACAS